MVSGTKTGWDSSIELGFCGTETDELLELLEEEVLEDIMNQAKTLENPKKIKKNEKQGTRGETERA